MGFFIMMNKNYLTFDYLKSEYKNILSLLPNTLTHINNVDFKPLKTFINCKDENDFLLFLLLLENCGIIYRENLLIKANYNFYIS